MTILIVLGSIGLILTLVISCSPQFGGSVGKAEREQYQDFPNYNSDKKIFENLTETSMDMNFKSIWSLLKDYIKGDSTRSPARDIATLPYHEFEADTVPKIMWFGHSSFLLQMNGKNILIDPMLSEVPSPYDFLGQPRYSQSLPSEIEELPQIDYVIISHDHYDHLDYKTIKALKSKTQHFLVPYGVSVHLKRWEIEAERIHELNWWDEQEMEGIKFAFTPSRHFSGRGLFDRFETLWGGWVIQSPNYNLYFSGDGGYGDHFKEIGEKYGPFDFTMIECGQYDERWNQIHMMPEESAQACVDLKTKTAMPVHWAAFTLALHSWTDPVERFSAKAQELELDYITPEIGEKVRIGLDHPTGRWWDKH